MQPNKNNKQSNREKIHTSWWTKGSFTIPPFPTCNDIEVLNSELKSSSFFIFPFSLFLRSNWRRYTIHYTIGIICRCPRPHTESEHMWILDFFLSFSQLFFGWWPSHRAYYLLGSNHENECILTWALRASNCGFTRVTSVASSFITLTTAGMTCTGVKKWIRPTNRTKKAFNRTKYW